MDVGSVKEVAGVVTQARRDSSQWVTFYTVQVSSNGNNFEDVDGGKVFSANKASDKADSKVENKFMRTVLARFVKIVVRSWHAWPSMRTAVLLLDNGNASSDNESEDSNKNTINDTRDVEKGL